jgi:alanyl-tRNA synthetase
MTGSEIRQKFLDFFAARGHKIVKSSSLLPDDPSVLFTTAGMQQFKPYYVGAADPERDFGGKNTASVQKCIRTSDIDEVGDERHLTFFEMLGNFSFGGYFSVGDGSASGGKERAIKYGYEFVTKEMGLAIDYVTVFKGENGVPADEESEKIWKSLDPNIVVKKFGRADNFWGPTGDEGPCGPTTEIYVDGIEIWNIVFNQYYQKKDKTLEPLKTPGIDTGMGLERLVKVIQKVPTVFETDLFAPVFKLLPDNLEIRVKRILADHVRSIAFLISDGVRPGNKDQGYVLRRLIRRVITHLHLSGPGMPTDKLFSKAVEMYKPVYPELDTMLIITEFKAEEEKFMKTLQNGLRELKRVLVIDAPLAFRLYESYGLPYEIIKELGGAKASGLKREGFDAEFRRHQEISRAGAEKKFGGHGLLLDTGELKAKDEEELKKVLRLHTATHLLQQALRDVLGPEVRQMGSDITVERTRFDFTFSRKMTDDEIRRVEFIVNQKIEEDLPMQFQEMSKAQAERTGALHFFKAKYPDTVKVYFVGRDLPSAYSKEFCGGPHVTHTGLIGKFRIAKEEGISAGVRRVRGVVE